MFNFFNIWYGADSISAFSTKCYTIAINKLRLRAYSYSDFRIKLLIWVGAIYSTVIANLKGVIKLVIWFQLWVSIE